MFDGKFALEAMGQIITKGLPVSALIVAATVLISMPLAFLLARGLEWGAAGVFCAMTLSHCASFAWTVRLFKGKKWLEYGMRRRQNEYSPISPDPGGKRGGC